MNVDDIIAAVKSHAVAEYEVEGWDFFVECYTDKDYRTAIIENKLDTEEKALAWFGKLGRCLNERRNAIQAEIF